MNSEIKQNEALPLYRVRPRWFICILLGMQHFLTMCLSNAMGTILILSKLCLEDDSPIKADMISTSFFAMGINTLLQTTIGTRLPIVQGATFSLLIPTLSYLSIDGISECNVTKSKLAADNNLNKSDPSSLFYFKVQMIGGALMISSLVEIMLSLTGMIAFAVRFISPLSLSAIYFVLSLSLTPTLLDMMGQNWPIGICGSLVIVVVIILVAPFSFPICFYSKSNGCSIKRYKIFEPIPIIVSLVIVWLIAGILTISNAFPNDPNHWAYKGRVDVKFNAIKNSNIFKLPYPLMWGPPKIGPGLVISMCFSVIISVVESVGDYLVTAQTIEAPKPPSFAISRGIMSEGIGLFLSGFIGSLVGPTSYSDNIPILRLTKVGHRSIIQVTGCIMIICGIFPVLGSLFISIPDPVIGGVSVVVILLIVGVSLNYLKMINVTSSRNYLVFGISVGIGLFLPYWFKKNPNVIQTGSKMADDIITTFFNFNLFITFVLSVLLDNMLPSADKKVVPIEDPSVVTISPHILKEREEQAKVKQYYRYKTYDTLFLRLLAIKVPCFQKLSIFPKYSSTKIPDDAMHVKYFCCLNSKPKYAADDNSISSRNNVTTF